MTRFLSRLFRPVWAALLAAAFLAGIPAWAQYGTAGAPYTQTANLDNCTSSSVSLNTMAINQFYLYSDSGVSVLYAAGVNPAGANTIVLQSPPPANAVIKAAYLEVVEYWNVNGLSCGNAPVSFGGGLTPAGVQVGRANFENVWTDPRLGKDIMSGQLAFFCDIRYDVTGLVAPGVPGYSTNAISTFVGSGGGGVLAGLVIVYTVPSPGTCGAVALGDGLFAWDVAEITPTYGVTPWYSTLDWSCQHSQVSTANQFSRWGGVSVPDTPVSFTDDFYGTTSPDILTPPKSSNGAGTIFQDHLPLYDTFLDTYADVPLSDPSGKITWALGNPSSGEKAFYWVNFLAASCNSICATFTFTPTATPTNTPTQASTPTLTPTPSPSSTATNSPTPTSSSSPTNSPTVTNTPTFTSTATNSPTPTPSSTVTNTPTNTNTSTPSDTATVSPTQTPTSTATVTPTNTLTFTSTNSPTVTDTPTSTNTATNSPTPPPSSTATDTPTKTYTFTPSNTATVSPTQTSTNTPTVTPTLTPTFTPTNSPTLTDTNTPTQTPTSTATFTPSFTPTKTYTFTVTFTPTLSFTETPTSTATFTPTLTDTSSPTSTPTPSFTPAPTATFTMTPVPEPYTVTIGVYNGAGELVRRILVEHAAQPVTGITLKPGNSITSLGGPNGSVSFYWNGSLLSAWDGTNASGTPVSNGTYYLKINSMDNQGNNQTLVQDITVSRPVETVKVEISNAAGEVVRILSRAQVSAGPVTAVQLSTTFLNPASLSQNPVTVGMSNGVTLTWDGTSDGGTRVTNGTYYLEVLSTDGIGAQEVFTEVVSVVNGGGLSPGLYAYPNPWHPGDPPLTLKTTSVQALTLKGWLYDLAGERVATWEGPAGTGQASLETGALASGIYVAVVEEWTANGTLASRQSLKVMVTR